MLCSRTSENAKQLEAAYDAYKRMLFPGSEKDKDETMERAKKALAEETKKIYVVRKLDTTQALRASVDKALAAGAPELAKAAINELRKKELEEAKVRKRLQPRRKE